MSKDLGANIDIFKTFRVDHVKGLYFLNLNGEGRFRLDQRVDSGQANVTVRMTIDDVTRLYKELGGYLQAELKERQAKVEELEKVLAGDGAQALPCCNEDHSHSAAESAAKAWQENSALSSRVTYLENVLGHFEDALRRIAKTMPENYAVAEKRGLEALVQL